MSQHDYDLANQTGAAFRTDVNSALLAIATLNSGDSEPSTTYAHQLWADTTSGAAFLKQRNSGNTAWKVLFAMVEGNPLNRPPHFNPSSLYLTDMGKIVRQSNAVSLPANAPAGWHVDIQNVSGASLIVSPNSGATIDASSACFLAPNDTVTFHMGTTSHAWYTSNQASMVVAAINQGYLRKSSNNLVFQGAFGVDLNYSGRRQPMQSPYTMTLTPSGTAADTLYYVYAYPTSVSSAALEYSTTAPLPLTNKGIYYKTGDSTRVMVGMAMTNSAGFFVDTPRERLVRSFFNDTGIEGMSVSSEAGTISSSYGPLSASTKCKALIWSRESLKVEGMLTAAAVSNSAQIDVAIGVNNTSTPPTSFMRYGRIETLVNRYDSAEAAYVNPSAVGSLYAEIDLLARVVTGSATSLAGYSGIVFSTNGCIGTMA